MSPKSRDTLQSARRAINRGDPAEARSLLRDYVTNNANDVAAWLLLGDAHRCLGEYDAASDAFRRVTQLDPTCAVAYSQLGVCCMELELFEEAEETLMQSVKLKATGDRFDLLGAVQSALGNAEAAEKSYRAALKLDPQHDEAMANLAVLIRDSDPGQARVLLEQAVSLASDNAVAHRELGYLCMKDGEFDRAEGLIRRATELEPDDPWGMIYLANVLWREGKLVETRDAYARACAVAPDSAFPFFWYGEYFWKTGDPERAEQLFRKAVSIEPDDPLACWHLGHCLMEANRSEEASLWLRRALELNPNHLYANDIRRMLNENG